MSVFDPESSSNRFNAEFGLTGDAGSPYEFGIRFSVDGDYFAVGGMSMGDMVRINREFARVIREAKHARVVQMRSHVLCGVRGLGVRGDGFLGTAGCDVPVCGHGAGGCAGAYRREVWP